MTSLVRRPRIPEEETAVRLAFLAATILALATACGGGPAVTTPPTSVPGATATATAGGPDTAQISCNDGGAGTAAEIFDFGFRPSPVTAGADLTVTWTNTGSAAHTVTFDTGPDCGTLQSGDMLSVLFPGAGSYAYHCEIHRQMTGTVTV
jgi:plastocyanin